jgi:hypothetical protein
MGGFTTHVDEAAPTGPNDCFEHTFHVQLPGVYVLKAHGVTQRKCPMVTFTLNEVKIAEKQVCAADSGSALASALCC